VLEHATPPADALQEMHYRSSHGQAWGRAFSLLLEKGMLMNYCTDNPLADAVSSQDLTAVRLLLQYGARKDACPKKPVTADSTNNQAMKDALAE